MSGSGPGGLQFEINVTPLVDVVLVLLIIFMVIVPLTLRGYDVDIAGRAIETAAPPPRREQVVLGIDVAACPLVQPPGRAGLPRDCRVRVNDALIPVTALGPRIAEIFASRRPEDRVLFLDVQEQLNYEGVMRVIDLARSGVPGLRIGLVVAAGGGERQRPQAI
jgi:biopolymer transport protein ExbD